jgi:hypothetical protein
MEEHITLALVRVWNTGRTKIQGVGFLATRQHVVTCAHVIADALNISRETVERPEASIELDFPLLARHPECESRVIHWNVELDIAILEVTTILPESSRPIVLHSTSELWNHEFAAFGFPSKADSGQWARGELLGPQADGWIQINDTQQHGYFVKRGFSGAPVWATRLEGVVGIVVAEHESARVAYMIPTTLLIENSPKDFRELIKSLRRTERKIAEPETQLTQHPTFYVDQWHRGDFTTIDEAISEAPPGAHIFVRPGIYREEVRSISTQGLEIIGEGERDEVVLELPDAGVDFWATTGRIANMTIAHRSKRGGGLIKILMGHLELENCVIYGMVSAGQTAASMINMNGSLITGPNPSFRISRSLVNGFLSLNSRWITLEENVLKGDLDLEDGGIPVGISIDSGQDIIIRNNTFPGCLIGIQVIGTCSALIEGNDFSGVKARALYIDPKIASSANLTIRGNRGLSSILSILRRIGNRF